mgnify:CR=1 FL=1
MNHFVPWDIRVTLDLFLGGLGVGAFLLSVWVGRFDDRERYSQIVKVGAFVAPIAVIVGLLFLLSELGRPERFITTLFRVNPTSVMSWGVFLQGGFVVIALLYALKVRKLSENPSSGAAVKVLGTVLALAVGLYHGLLLSSNVARPLWRDGVFPLIMLLSSLLAGIAFVLLVSSITARRVSSASDAKTGYPMSLARLLAGLTLFTVLSLFTWYLSLLNAGLEAAEALNALLTAYGALWWGGAIVLGLIVPLVLLLLYILSSKDPQADNLPLAVGSAISVLLLVGSFVLKHVLLQAGQVNFPGLF